MSLKHEIKPFKTNRLVEYFGGPGSDSTIDKRPFEKSGEHEDGYVLRQWIGFERYDCLSSSTVRHSEVHDDQIWMSRTCFFYAFTTCNRFNGVIARLFNMEQKQSPNFRIVIDD